MAGFIALYMVRKLSSPVLNGDQYYLLGWLRALTHLSRRCFFLPCTHQVLWPLACCLSLSFVAIWTRHCFLVSVLVCFPNLGLPPPVSSYLQTPHTKIHRQQSTRHQAYSSRCRMSHLQLFRFSIQLHDCFRLSCLLAFRLYLCWVYLFFFHFRLQRLHFLPICLPQRYIRHLTSPLHTQRHPSSHPHPHLDL